MKNLTRLCSITAIALLAQGCTQTLRGHLRGNSDLPPTYGLVLPWTGDEYLGYEVKELDGEPLDGKPLNKRSITPSAQRCFLPADSAKRAAAGSWSSEFQYNAEEGLKFEVPAECAEAVGNVSAFQGGTFRIETVQVFEGLGHPTASCIDVPEKPDQANLYEAKLLVIDRVARAARVSLNSSAGVDANVSATMKCIENVKPSATVKLEVKGDGSFDGSNLVVATHATNVRLSSFASPLRKLPGGTTPPENVVVFAADEGSNMTAFGGKQVPAYLQPVRIIHAKYDGAAASQVQFRVVGVAALPKAPEGAPPACAAVEGESTLYVMKESDSCFIYSGDMHTTLQISVEKSPSVEEVGEKGLLIYRLRAFRWDEI